MVIINNFEIFNIFLWPIRCFNANLYIYKAGAFKIGNKFVVKIVGSSILDSWAQFLTDFDV